MRRRGLRLNHYLWIAVALIAAALVAAAAIQIVGWWWTSS
jgi:hypothetical protein